MAVLTKLSFISVCGNTLLHVTRAHQRRTVSWEFFFKFVILWCYYVRTHWNAYRLAMAAFIFLHLIYNKELLLTGT